MGEFDAQSVHPKHRFVILTMMLNLTGSTSMTKVQALLTLLFQGSIAYAVILFRLKQQDAS